MTNKYIHNTIDVVGEEAAVADFVQCVKDENSDFNFNCIVPMPRDLCCDDLLYRYAWSALHWGTERGPYNIQLHTIDATHQRYTFDTFDTAPRSIFFTLKQQFPQLTITCTSHE